MENAHHLGVSCSKAVLARECLPPLPPWVLGVMILGEPVHICVGESLPMCEQRLVGKLEILKVFTLAQYSLEVGKQAELGAHNTLVHMKYSPPKSDLLKTLTP